jgi:hypothetical protein
MIINGDRHHALMHAFCGAVNGDQVVKGFAENCRPCTVAFTERAPLLEAVQG